MRRRIGLAAACLLAALGWLSCGRAAAACVDAHGDGHQTIIDVSGRIISGDAANFDKALKRGAVGVPTTVFLNSPGGDVSEAINISQKIRALGLHTYIQSPDKCVSSCFFLFAAGVGRVAEATTFIGIHLPDNEKEMLNSQLFSYLAGWGVSAGIIDKLKATPSNRFTWLTEDDLLAMGVEIRADRDQPTPLVNLH